MLNLLISFVIGVIGGMVGVVLTALISAKNTHDKF